MLRLGHPQVEVPVGHVDDERDEAGQHQRQKTHAQAELVNAPLESLRRWRGGGLRFLVTQTEIEICPDPSYGGYSHSMVLGGFELMSYTTRFTPATSLMMRLDTRARKSCGSRAQSAVMASRLVTARIAAMFS